LRELLTNYGEIAEVWFDGAKGEGEKAMEYDFKGYWQMVTELQPSAVMFSDVGPSIRWVGNESGSAGETCWSSITTDGMSPGKADPYYLNTGDPNGKYFIPPETDVSIRPGWFNHPSEDRKVKTGKELVNLYYNSVGRNSLLLLNIPPNKDGLLSEKDVSSLYDFRQILNETFKTNLIENSTFSGSDWKDELMVNDTIIIEFTKEVSFDRAMLQEDIVDGQINDSTLIEYWNGSKWKKIVSFTTIGFKKLLRFSLVTTAKVRITVNSSKGKVKLANVGFYKASSRE